jgi:hypothetical protein
MLTAAIRSFRKSSKLAKLQRKLHPPNQSIRDIAASLREQAISGFGARDRALSDYLDLCESDPGVQNLMRMYALSRSDLTEIYAQAMLNGLGRWVKGHYAALSTIAYVEPLQYFVEGERQGKSRLKLYGDLLSYWSGDIRQGALLASL